MAEKQSRLFYFESSDSEVIESIGRYVTPLIWLFWIRRLEKFPRIEGMEKSIDVGLVGSWEGTLNLSLLDSSPGETGRKWGTNRTPQDPQGGLVDLRAERACVLCWVEPMVAAKPWSSHCSAGEATMWSVLLDRLGILLQGFLAPQQGVEARKLSSWAFKRTQIWLAESSWLDETVGLGWGWPALMDDQTIVGWGCLLDSVCTNDYTKN